MAFYGLTSPGVLPEAAKTDLRTEFATQTYVTDAVAAVPVGVTSVNGQTGDLTGYATGAAVDTSISEAVSPVLVAEARTAKLDRSGAGDRAVALGASQVAYQDAYALSEKWADLTAWTVSGPLAAASGTAYTTSTTGTEGTARHALDLGGTEHLMVTGTITSVSGGSTSDYTMVRVVKTVNGYISGDSMGVGFRGDGTPITYVGTSVGGAGSQFPGPISTGKWTYAIYADATWVSASMTSPDGLTTYTRRTARSAFNSGITFAVVTSGDRRGLSGHTFGPLSIRKATASPKPPLSGLTAREITTQTNGQDSRIILPPGFDSRKPAPVIISAHGNTQTQDHMNTTTQRATLVRAFGDQGFIYASSHMHGNQWGAQAAITDLVELYKYLRDRYPVGPLVILGESMGSLATMNAVHRAALPIAGVGIVDGVMNLGWQYQNGVSGGGVPDSDGIKAAYGIAADGSDYATKTAGYDPALADPQSFRGVPLRFLASPDDTRVPKANHADVLYDRISAVYPETTSRVNATDGHTVDSHFFASTWLDWFRSCVSTV